MINKVKTVAKSQKLVFSRQRKDFLDKGQKLHNMLNIEVFDLKRSHSL